QQVRLQLPVRLLPDTAEGSQALAGDVAWVPEQGLGEQGRRRARLPKAFRAERLACLCHRSAKNKPGCPRFRRLLVSSRNDRQRLRLEYLPVWPVGATRPPDVLSGRAVV